MKEIQQLFSNLKSTFPTITITDILENKPDMNQFNGFVRDAILGKLINPQIYDATSFQ